VCLGPGVLLGSGLEWAAKGQEPELDALELPLALGGELAPVKKGKTLPAVALLREEADALVVVGAELWPEIVAVVEVVASLLLPQLAMRPWNARNPADAVNERRIVR